jgi:hypothetical protein
MFALSRLKAQCSSFHSHHLVWLLRSGVVGLLLLPPLPMLPPLVQMLYQMLESMATTEEVATEEGASYRGGA